VDSPKIEAPPRVVDFWHKNVGTAPWFKDDKEFLCVFLLNTRHQFIGFELVSQGTLDTLLVHPREVLRPALVHNAAAIVIAHNHPSGDPTPSESDITVTRNLIQAADVLRIPLLDHVIIGDVRRENSFASLSALGYFAPERATAPAEHTAPGQIKTGRGGVCKEALAAFAELEKSAAAVIALAAMNANNIKYCTDSFAAWEDFDSPLFQAGNLELPRILEDQFERDLSAWRSGAEQSAFGVENAVYALKHLVTLQGNEFDVRNNDGSFALSVLVADRLESAFRKAWKADHKPVVAAPAVNAGEIRQAA